MRAFFVYRVRFLYDTEVNPLAQKQALDPAKFDIEHDVPVFDEHEIEEPVYDPATGDILEIKTIKYTKSVLESMCKNMNSRINDTGDYTAICLGHTPTPSEKKNGVPQPPLVGFCGPFKVGKIGSQNTRYAIIAENWAIFKDESDRAKKYPRRSVEVWREDNPRDRYIEPVALLGAETPRRDLGLAYSRMHAGVMVERYTAAAPCFPGANNTYIPGGSKKKSNYAAPETQGGGMSLSDDDINKIIAAVMELDTTKFVQGLMEQSQAKAPETPAAPAAPGAPGQAPGQVPDPTAEAPEADPTQDPLNPEADMPAQDPTKDAPEDKKPPFDKKERNAQGEGGDGQDDDYGDEKYSKNRDLVTRYAAIESHNKQLATALEQQSARLKIIETQALQSERYSQIEQLKQVHIFDEDAERERATRYSAEQWKEHVEAVFPNYERNPVGFQPIANPIKPAKVGQDETTKYSRIERLAASYVKQGVYKSFDELEHEVAKEHK